MVLQSDAGAGKIEYPGELLRRILYLDQDAGKDLVPSMTVMENVGLAQIGSWAGLCDWYKG